MKKKKSLRGMTDRWNLVVNVDRSFQLKILYLFLYMLISISLLTFFSNIAVAAHSSHYSGSKTKSCSCNVTFSPSYNLNWHYSANITKSCSCSVTVYASELHGSHSSHWSHWSHWSHGSRR